MEESATGEGCFVRAEALTGVLRINARNCQHYDSEHENYDGEVEQN